MIRQFATPAADDAVSERIFNPKGNLTKAEGLTDRERRFACMMLRVFNPEMLLKEEFALAMSVGVHNPKLKRTG
jgi:hypothetical protein